MLIEDLSTLPDNVLVENVKNNSCSDSFTELSRRHSSLFFKVCNSYVKILSSMGVPVQDVFEEKDAVLLESINHFDPNHKKQVKFSTYFGNRARYFCLHKIKKTNKMPEVSDEEAIAQEFNLKSIENYNRANQPTVNLYGLINKLVNAPDKRIENIFKLRYDPNLAKKMTFEQIAEKLDLSISNTQHLHELGLEYLRKEIDKKNIEVFL